MGYRRTTVPPLAWFFDRKRAGLVQRPPRLEKKQYTFVLASSIPSVRFLHMHLVLVGHRWSFLDVQALPGGEKMVGQSHKISTFCL